MTVADISLLVSVLVVVVILAKMVRAIRLLDGRVSVLQEQLEHSRASMQMAAVGKPPGKPSGGRTPIEGVPIIAPVASSRRTPPPEEAPQETPSPGEATTHVIEQGEADAVWSRLEAEQERLRKAMGRDFQARKRSASDIRGKPVARTLSAQQVAKKLERR